MKMMSRNEISRQARKIMEKKKKVCANCGSTESIEIHHIVPVSQCGSNKRSNLVYLCNECHRKAHGRVMSASDDGMIVSKKEYDYLYENLKEATREDLLIILANIKHKGSFKIVNNRLITPHMEEWLEMEAKCMKKCRPWEFNKLLDYMKKLADGDNSVISQEELFYSLIHERSHELGLPPQKVLDIITEAIKNDQEEVDWSKYEKNS